MKTPTLPNPDHRYIYTSPIGHKVDVRFIAAILDWFCSAETGSGCRLIVDGESVNFRFTDSPSTRGVRPAQYFVDKHKTEAEAAYVKLLTMWSNKG